MNSIGRITTPNSAFVTGEDSCFADNFVFTVSSILRISTCAEKPANHESANVKRKPL